MPLHLLVHAGGAPRREDFSTSAALEGLRGSLVPVTLLALASCLGACDPGPAARGGSAAGDERAAEAEVEIPPVPDPGGRPVGDEVEEQLAHEDPDLEHWESEVLHDRAKPVLESFVKAIEANHPENFFPPLLAPEFTTSALLPADLERIFDDGAVTVEEATGTSPERHGTEALGDLIPALVGRFDHEGLHSSSKIIAMYLGEPGSGRFESDALVRLAGPTAGHGLLQVNMEWRVGFQTQGEAVRIRSVDVTSYREIHVASPLFADLTRQVFSSIPRFREDFLIGTGEYQFRQDRLDGNAYTGSMGLALGDLNGDGLDDVLVCQPGGTPTRVLLRQPDGSVEDASERSGLNLLSKTQSVLILDLDNDGDQDVALASKSGIVLAENDGSGVFGLPRRPLVAGGDEITSLSAADFDRDGDLDLYACMYAKAGPLGTMPVPYHDAVNGPRNHLWRNDGDWSFTNVTAETGLDENNVKFSYAAVWADFDSDGDPDLYVANDFGRNNLYRNDNGRFRDVAREVGADDMAAGMGVTVADFDQDGAMDLYVTNMFSSAGRRIVPQPSFMNGENPELQADYLRHARGNTLLLNRGDGTFEDATERGGSAIAGWAWGSKSLDLNNDGRPDVYSPNGWLSGTNTKDL